MCKGGLSITNILPTNNFFSNIRSVIGLTVGVSNYYQLIQNAICILLSAVAGSDYFNPGPE